MASHTQPSAAKHLGSIEIDRGMPFRRLAARPWRYAVDLATGHAA
jgi:hypothetical protein